MAMEYVTQTHLNNYFEEKWSLGIMTLTKEIITQIIRNIQTPVYGTHNLIQYRDTTITTDVTQPACPTEVAAATTLIDIVMDAISTNAVSGTRTLPTGSGNGPCANVAATITTMFGIITDTINSGSSLDSVNRSLPSIWPCHYHGDVSERDLTVTYQTAAATWDQTCATTASAISTLFDVVVNTIESAKTNTNHLSGLTRTVPPYTNTLYQQYTCYNVVSAMTTAFDLITDTLGAGSYSNRNTGHYLRFNDQAITSRALAATLANYPLGDNPDLPFFQAVLEAGIYDLTTDGNASAFELAGTWFDGEGQFIAYPTVDRIRLLYGVNKIREYAKEVVQDPENAGWNTYDVYRYPEVQGYRRHLEWDQETTEFNFDSSLNCLEFAIERATFPTDNLVTFNAATDVVNYSNKYDEGVDYNTDPALVNLTPTVEVGYEREENRARITRTNFFRRGDVVKYVLASANSLSGANDQPYYYVLNAQADWFEIARMPKHDARYRPFALDTTNAGNQQFFTVRRSGIDRIANTYGTRDIDQPITAGFNIADVLVGTTTGASAEIASSFINNADIVKSFKYYGLNTMSSISFVNGEQVQVQGATANNGYVMQRVIRDENQLGWIKLELVQGTISAGQTIEGVDSGATAIVTAVVEDRMLINTKVGEFLQGDWMFKDTTATEAYLSSYDNKSGVLTDNSGGRVTIDVETITGAFQSGDIIYGSKTEKILDFVGITDGGSPITINTYIHGEKVRKLTLSQVITDSEYSGTFVKGDKVYLLQGTTPTNPGWWGYVTKYDYRPDDNVNDLYIAGLQNYWTGDASEPTTEPDGSLAATGGYNIGKFDNLQNFPLIYATASNYTETGYSSYGKIISIEQSGITARCWLEDVQGDFVDNMTVKSDGGWIAGVSTAQNLLGRVDRYFRGFDGTQTQFNLTISNGQQYLPDPAGHMLIFVNGILQPPGATGAYTASSDIITFAEAPDVGSDFIGYYIGKLRQLDDISFEFDSLRSSFNLKQSGGFYSLTLTEGVQSNVIKPENNIMVSLNGVIQEPGVGYELVGSRIIFAEVPRAGTTFVGFSYIGSDADVIAATVVPPIEAGDQLFIEGEDEIVPREVALIESSNSLVTFEYTGTVKGRNAAALASVRSGTIEQTIITNPGNGYTETPSVSVISSTGFDGRVRALMGVARIDIGSAGIGYAQPIVAVENTVEDTFVSPDGPPVNGGFDVYAGEGINAQTGEPIEIEAGLIAITRNPSNVTVNQGQTASFTVVAHFSAADGDPAETIVGLNYQWQVKQYGETAWANITGATAATYNSNATIQADDADEFRVAITYAGATPVYSNSAVLSVQTGNTVVSNFDPSQIFQQ